MEWALKQDIFTAIIGPMGNCDIDLFATRKKCKLEKYVSYVPDKRSCAVNAFSISWKQYTNYAFPPLSIIRRVIQKLCEHLAEMILVALIFPSQPWFRQMLKQVSGPYFLLPKTNNILYIPGTEKKHRLTTMRLGAFQLSGNAVLVQDYQKTLQISSCSHGDLPQKILKTKKAEEAISGHFAGANLHSENEEFRRTLLPFIAYSNPNDKYILPERALLTMNFDTSIIKVGRKMGKLWAFKTFSMANI